jgi:hypothetical protein
VPAQEGTTLCSTWIAPDYPLRRGVQARARASRELSRSVWVTGQSVQSSKLHTAGEHRPGGPTTAGAEPDTSDVRRACTGQEPQGSGPVAKLALGRTSNPRILPRREDHAGSRRSRAGAERSPVDGGGTGVRVMDIDGARRRSLEPTAGWLELGLGWPESTHRWTGTPGRAASLDCSWRSKERDAGRARLDRVRAETHGGPGRAGSKTRRWDDADPDHGSYR